MIRIVHVNDEVLAPLRARYGSPIDLEWSGEITEREHALATYNPDRTHDVTLFILDPVDRIALIRKPHFARGIWRPPGGGIKPGEDFALGAEREALEETGLRARLERYLVATHASFVFESQTARVADPCLPRPARRTRCSHRATRTRSQVRRWGTLPELAGPAARATAGDGARALALPGRTARRRAQGSSRMNE